MLPQEETNLSFTDFDGPARGLDWNFALLSTLVFRGGLVCGGMKATKNFAHYVEELSRSIAKATPYYTDSDAKLRGERATVNTFPSQSGIYLIMRRVALPDSDYTTRGVNTRTPLILYVGKTTSARSIKARLRDHFGGKKPNYQGSQFRKFLYQICQDHEAVHRILWSRDTLVACVPIEENDNVIDAVEKLAIQIFQPRFNIKDR